MSKTGISQIVQGQRTRITELEIFDSFRGPKGEQGEAGRGIDSVWLNDDDTLEIAMTDGSSYRTESIRGAKGEKGDTGAQGLPYHIKGSAFGTLDALRKSVASPEVGDLYNVGEAAPYDVYRWTGEDWENQGKNQGPKGERGDTGAVGPQGPKGDTGEIGATGNGIASAQLQEDYTLKLTFTDGTTYTTPVIRGEIGAAGPQGPKGETGEAGPKGDTGAAAGFGNVTASIDANVGTPSVTVEVSGEDTGKNFAFTFKNLKGEKGDTGAQGPKGDTGETGPQGPKGEGGTMGKLLWENENPSAAFAAQTTVVHGADGYSMFLVLFTEQADEYKQESAFMHSMIVFGNNKIYIEKIQSFVNVIDTSGGQRVKSRFAMRHFRVKSNGSSASFQFYSGYCCNLDQGEIEKTEGDKWCIPVAIYALA